MDNIREIGKVKLDYRHYAGRELYSDGEIENELLEIARDHSPAEFPRIIEERGSWPVFYHFSHLRHNSVEWLPFDKKAKVLEIGSGCGAITGLLADKAGAVVGVDLSDRRSQINAYRHADKDNITLLVGNFKDIEPDLPADFDYVLLIGVFEYACLYMDGAHPYEAMLRIMKRHLKPDGRLVMAIENKFGLKYWAGCAEDHSGTFFSGLEGYPDGGSARTFTRKGLEKLLGAGGFTDYSFYYPYPDYKFMTNLYSDERLPTKGELIDNIRNFDRDRLVLFNEKEVFDGIIEDGLFPDFANSYLVVTGNRPATAFARYSNDRAPATSIRTAITTGPDKAVIKSPLCPEAAAHVLRMEETYHALCKQYAGSGLAINRCERSAGGEGVIFEFISGTTLAEQMDACLESDDRAGFMRLFDRYWEYVSYPAAVGDNGEKSAGHPAAEHDRDVNKSVNYDFIFSNIIISDDGSDQWTLIDYEWVAAQAVTPAEIAFRALHCYLLEEAARRKLNLDLMMQKIGVTPQMAAEYRANEAQFQQRVGGGRLSAGEIRLKIGTRQIDPRKMIALLAGDSGRQVQIYYDRGQGFSEEDSDRLPDAYIGAEQVRAELSVAGNVRALRLDPADRPCAVKIKQLLWNGTPIALDKKLLGVNGRQLGVGYYVFPTADPNISVAIERLNRRADNRLVAELEVVILPADMAVKIAAAAKKTWR